MTQPQISVVMSVYNDADTLKQTIQSILSQTMTDFEFIIVNDGSIDQSQNILEAARLEDSRIVLLEQSNQGLTQALANGCNIARADIIARQDNGDYSDTNRFKAQLNYLNQHSKSVMVSCGTDFIGPEGELLYKVIQSQYDAETGLKITNETGKSAASEHTLRGPPHHGGVMFRRDIYQQVGGYRPVFRVAQDIDLWTRLLEHGTHFSLPDVYYRASIARNSISMLLRDQQLMAVQMIIDCGRARQNIGNDQAVLEQIKLTAKTVGQASQSTAKTDSDYYYFLASNLLNTEPAAAQRYLKLALSHNPWHLKARLKLLMNIVRKPFKKALNS